MRIYMPVITAILAVALVCTVSVADPYTSVWYTDAPEKNVSNSWIGSTGMYYTPTARTAPAQAMVSSIHWVNTEPNAMTTLGINVGITPNFELGGVRIADGFGGDETEVIANAKYNIDLTRILEQEELPELAVGAWDIGNEFNQTFYVVMTKDLAIKEDADVANLRFSIGYSEADINTDNSLDGLFGGIEFVPFEDGLIQLEYDGGDFNGGLRYYPNEWISLEVASLDGDAGLGFNVHTGF